MDPPLGPGLSFIVSSAKPKAQVREKKLMGGGVQFEILKIQVQTFIVASGKTSQRGGGGGAF